jgi:cytochrome c oxidase assembly protein subunit 15
MVLFPLALMAEPRIFLEHSHRLFGMLVGVATVATALSVQFARTTPRAPGIARAVAWAAIPIVIIQGVLGGTRVTENSPALAVLHGILAQVFFMTLAALVALLIPAWATRSATDRGVAKLAKVYLVLLLIQLTFGALFRHLGERSAHPLYAHIALALVIVVLAAILGPRLAKAAGDGRAPAATRRVGKAISHSTAFQFFLGFGALAGAMMGSDRGPIPLHTQLEGATPVPAWEVILTTLHQANGAILLVMAGLAVVWTVGGRGLPRQGGDRSRAIAPDPAGTDPAAS